MAYPQAGPNRFTELLQQYYSRGFAPRSSHNGVPIAGGGNGAATWAQQMLDRENADTQSRFAQDRTQQVEDRTFGLTSRNADRDFEERARQFNATQDNSRYALDQSNSLARDLMGQRTNAFQTMMQGGNNFRYQPLPQAQTPPWMRQGNGDMNNALIKMLLGQMGA